MKNIILILFSLFTWQFACAQSTISGTVLSKTGEKLPGANIYFLGTYDGTSSNTDGSFSLQTRLSGEQALVVSFIGYVEERIALVVKDHKDLEIILSPIENKLNEVVIAAGAFEAGDEKRGVVLKPLDILTTPTAEGDIYGALKTLPGAQTVGEDGRLFVRGGDHYESSTFIDGMLVQQPYFSTTPDIPARGRFNPQLFTGTLFSTGGFSAEYGQALSSALILNTLDLPQESFTSISLLNVGAGAGHTQKWDDKGALSVSLDYTNLKPYFALAQPEQEYIHEPELYGGTISARRKFGKSGIWKSMATFSHDHTAVYYPNLEEASGDLAYDLLNDNAYFNTVVRNTVNSSWMYYGGISAGWNRDDVKPGNDHALIESKAMQAKYGMKYSPYNGMTLNMGAIYSFEDYSRKYKDFPSPKFQSAGFQEHNPAAYIEGEWSFSGKFALKSGFRGEYSSLNKQFSLAPRLALAYSIGKYGQFSAAYGQFYQSPMDEYLAFAPELDYEEAQHYIVNYQYQQEKRIFRAEAYYKKYDGLTKFNMEKVVWDPQYYTNEGHGYAKGIDIFYRDWQSIDYLDFWVSYSYIDTKRDYRYYPEEVQPSFVADHQLSVVGKYWVNGINTQFGASYSFTSGRPYEDPNEAGFMNQKTKTYHNLSLNISHLMDIFGNFTIIYASVSNVTGADHTYAYRYHQKPGADGKYLAYPVTDGIKNFVVLGVFVSIN